jgi:hypothetical protein
VACLQTLSMLHYYWKRWLRVGLRTDSSFCWKDYVPKPATRAPYLLTIPSQGGYRGLAIQVYCMPRTLLHWKCILMASICWYMERLQSASESSILEMAQREFSTQWLWQCERAPSCANNKFKKMV